MPSPFDAALARADAAQLRIFGESCAFHNPAADPATEDAPIVVIFSERDTAEPPSNMSAARGQYSRAWTTLTSFPAGITNPEGYQILSGADAYWIRQATADGGGGIAMYLHKVRPA